MTHRTRISSEAHEALGRIKEKKILREIYKAFESLATDPASTGKELRDDLEGYRSIHAWRDLYRIVFQIKEGEVIMIMVGRRLPGKEEDIYQTARKLVKNMRDLV